MHLKKIALVPLAALAILAIPLSEDWVRPRLEAQLGWDPHQGFDLDLHVTIELPFARLL